MVEGRQFRFMLGVTSLRHLLRKIARDIGLTAEELLGRE